MPITTKTGDQGTTGVAGKRVDKDSAVIEVLGSLDELAAVVGIAVKNTEGMNQIGKKINHDLYRIMARISGYGEEVDLKEEVKRMGQDIDNMEEEIKKFQIPGEELEEYWNWVRTVCRRSERRLITLNKLQPIGPNILIYINRLSDYLFVLSRRFKK